MIEGVILDLDGTVYHDDRPIPGAPAFIGRLTEAGIPFVFATNRANRSPETITAMLRGYGLEIADDQVVTAAVATAEHLRPRGTVFVIGEEPLVAAMTREGFALASSGPDYVVVGLDRGLTYAKLNSAVRAILAGARFIATNPDLLVNAADGSKDVGNGTIVAAISAATGREPLVIGKPHAPLLQAALRKLGLAKQRVLVVGDNLETDIAGGIAAGMKSALILTGISSRAEVERLGIRPDFVVGDYGELADVVFA